MKKLFVLTGAGMSVESGLSTFRDADGLWENYPVARVATHEAWLEDPVYVNNFYNMLRKKLLEAKPNEGHRLVAALERKYDVTVVTQNVDNLHEEAGSSHVIHLHGELMKACSSRDTEDPRCWRTMTAGDLDIKPGEKAGDGSLLRPYIVFFGEAVAQRLPGGEPRAVRQVLRAHIPHRPEACDGCRAARRAPHPERRVGGYARAIRNPPERRMTTRLASSRNQL